MLPIYAPGDKVDLTQWNNHVGRVAFVNPCIVNKLEEDFEGWYVHFTDSEGNQASLHEVWLRPLAY